MSKNRKSSREKASKLLGSILPEGVREGVSGDSPGNPGRPTQRPTQRVLVEAGEDQEAQEMEVPAGVVGLQVSEEQKAQIQALSLQVERAEEGAETSAEGEAETSEAQEGEKNMPRRKKVNEASGNEASGQEAVSESESQEQAQIQEQAQEEPKRKRGRPRKGEGAKEKQARQMREEQASSQKASEQSSAKSSGKSPGKSSGQAADAGSEPAQASQDKAKDKSKQQAAQEAPTGSQGGSGDKGKTQAKPDPKSDSRKARQLDDAANELRPHVQQYGEASKLGKRGPLLEGQQLHEINKICEKHRLSRSESVALQQKLWDEIFGVGANGDSSFPSEAQRSQRRGVYRAWVLDAGLGIDETVEHPDRTDAEGNPISMSLESVGNYQHLVALKHLVTPENRAKILAFAMNYPWEVIHKVAPHMKIDNCENLIDSWKSEGKDEILGWAAMQDTAKGRKKPAKFKNLTLETAVYESFVNETVPKISKLIEQAVPGYIKSREGDETVVSKTVVLEALRRLPGYMPDEWLVYAFKDMYGTLTPEEYRAWVGEDADMVVVEEEEGTETSAETSAETSPETSVAQEGEEEVDIDSLFDEEAPEEEPVDEFAETEVKTEASPAGAKSFKS